MRRGGIIIATLGITAAYFIGKALNKASSNIPDRASIIEAEEAAGLAEYCSAGDSLTGIAAPIPTASSPRSSRIPSAGNFFHGHLCTCCEGDGWRTAFPVVPPFHEAGYDD